jgi:hypothetical protein
LISERIADEISGVGKTNRCPCGEARASGRHACCGATRVPGVHKRPEFDANAVKGRFIKRLGNPGQIAKFLRKQRGIVVAGGQHAGNAEADHLVKHIEDFPTAQIDVEKNTVGEVLLNRCDDAADLRHEADNLATEAAKN